IIDEARDSRRRAPIEMVDSLQQDTQATFLSVEEQLSFQQILHAVQNELTDDQRHVIILRFLEQFSLRETAAIMGKRVDHVKVIQNRAIAALRRSLEYSGVRKIASSRRIRDLSKAVGV
ncbi:MAG TPA: sigma-70 family RNA polymerase sigma factor, partial [Candidatus Binatia bacterium]|nr:sigma-70 family RNA polymerase sigma factor [Candidatus Binatia bacterium]